MKTAKEFVITKASKLFQEDMKEFDLHKLSYTSWLDFIEEYASLKQDELIEKLLDYTSDYTIFVPSDWMESGKTLKQWLKSLK